MLSPNAGKTTTFNTHLAEKLSAACVRKVCIEFEKKIHAQMHNNKTEENDCGISLINSLNHKKHNILYSL